MNQQNIILNDWKYWLHTVVFFVLMLGISHMEARPPLTPLGIKTLGIFIGVLYAWSFIDIIWPSMAGMLAIMVLGVMSPMELFHKSFGDSIVVMMLFIFAFCATVSHYGLSKFISLWFISRKCVRGRPWLFTFTLLASVMLLGGLTSATPAVLLGWSLLYGVCEICGYKKGDSYAQMMFFGVVFAAQFGMSLIPFKAAPLAIIGVYEKISHTPINYASYMLIAFLAGFILLGLFIFVGKFLFRPDTSKLKDLDVDSLDRDNALVLNFQQKLVLFFLCLLFISMLAPSILPADFFFTRFIKSIGYTGICIMVVMGMACIRIDKKPLLPVPEMIAKGVSWEIIFVLTFVFGITSPMSSAGSGITQFFMLALDPVFGQNSQVIFMISLGLFSLVLTQVCNNVALGAALMPIIFTYCSANNFAPEGTIIIVVLALHLAMLTPAASSPAALLHGNDWCDKKTLWTIAPIILVLSYAVLVLLIWGLNSFLF